MDTKKELINDLGFSDKKATIYLTLVQFGEMSVTQLARRANLKRTTVYNILPELLSEGFVNKTKSAGKTFYYVNKVEDIEHFLNEKKDRVKILVSELKKSVGVFDFKPKITIYEGLGGIKKLYQDIVDSVNSGDKILTFIGTKNLESFLPQNVIQHYVNQRIGKKVRNLIIASPEQASLDWQQSAEKELREIKITKFPYPNFSADLKIYGNKIALVSYKENFFAVAIESTELSLLHKNIFELMWNSLSEK
ncbi:MAG: helix-turn-helix domain-containing protein [bacterium]|nr:helix-turn-helix domain-containing protein [bacterium]